MSRGGKPLRTFLRILIIILTLIIIGMIYTIFDKEQDETGQNQMSHQNKIINSPLEQEINNNIKIEGIFQLVGQHSADVKAKFGEPNRIDPSLFGFNWWVYNENEKKYFQVGIKDDKVVTLYIVGEKLNIKPFRIGQSIADIYSSYFIPSDLELDYKGESYLFELSEEDMNIRPIITMEHLYVQLYIDKFNGTLSSVRVMDPSTLIKVKPFDYRQEYIEAEGKEEELNKAQTEALQNQIFDLTNVIRNRHKLRPLQWDEVLAKSAYERSVELFEEEQKSIESTVQQEENSNPNQDHHKQMYLSEGENRAIYQWDAPAIVEGWLNSVVQRENILNKDYQESGIGIYSGYLVQRFSPLEASKVQ